MCKYCKRLEEVRKKERDNFIKCIRSHQRYERKLFALCKRCYEFMDTLSWESLFDNSLYRDLVVLFYESEVNDDA